MAERQCQRVEADFTVVGAGIAGMIAAVSAARQGLRVALINDRPVPGGNASSEIGVAISGACHQSCNPSVYSKECGIMEELRNMITEYAASGGYGEFALLDAVFFDFLEREKNLVLYLNTTVMEVSEEKGEIISVRAYHSRSEQWFEFVSPLYADCSGDGILAFKAGARFRQGRDAKRDFGEFWAPEEGDSTTMGNTVFFEIEDMGHPVEYHRPAFAYDITQMEFMKWLDKKENFRSFGVSGKFWTLEIGGDRNIIKDNEEITMELRRLVFGIWDYVKNSGRYPNASNYALKRVYTMAGIRESRRFIGEYTLTETDIEEKRRFEDSVCIGGWPMDVHAPKGLYDEAPASHFIPVTSIYNIPYRCLYARDVKNLFLAGRNISATHIAMGSTRVMATCGCMGQAVGTAAALCAKESVNPGQVDIKALQRKLIADDQTIVGWSDCLAPELSKGWQVTASSEKICQAVREDKWISLDRNYGLSIPVQTERLDSVSVKVKNCGGKPEELSVDILEGRCRSSYLPEKRVKTVVVPVKAEHDGWLKLPLNAAPGEDGKVHFVLRKHPAFQICTSTERPLGVISHHYYTESEKRGYNHDSCPLAPACGYFAKDHKRIAPLCFCGLEPEQRLYRPENILNDYSRPYGQPNLWISAEGESQWISLHSDSPRRIEELQLLFDTGLDEEERRLEPAPTLVKSYSVEINGRVIYQKADNYYRLNRISLQENEVTDIRIRIESSHGGGEARIYALRLR